MKKKMTRGRRLLALLLAAVLLVATLPTYASAAWFSDVPYGAWYADAVNDLADRGVMNGKSPGKFKPNDTLTRGEFVTMLARSALSEWELGEYVYSGSFSDVPWDHWANPYVNWAHESGVVNGVGGGKFAPSRKVTRQDMAVMVANFAKATGLELPAINGPMMFLDYNSIADYAVASVTACQRAGIINGYEDMTFKPKGAARRNEAAAVFSRFLNRSQSAGYKIIRKRMNGTAIAAVEFDPSNFTANVAMGKGQVRGGEGMGSIVSRTGAKIAVNAAFFNMSSYDCYGTVINQGRPVTVYNDFSPAKSAITMDSSGWFSVENFKTNVSLTVNATDGSQQVAHSVGVNRFPVPGDGTRLVFTKDWGGSLGFAPKYAAVVDEEGFVTAAYQDQDVSIPSTGFVVVQRAARWDDTFARSLTPGAFVGMDVEYAGASTQDIQLSIGVGPKLVENGRSYGNTDTYAAEGFGSLDTLGDARRMCIGVRYDGRLVILTAYTSLPELSDIMVAMGCESAINLDGGGSANLFVGGQWLYGPQSRPLNSVLYFTK